MLGTLIYFLILVVVCGALLAIVNVAPLDPTLKQIGKIVVIAILVIAVLYFLAGLLPGFPQLHAGR